MSAVGDILLAPDVRPFAVAAAIMVALGGIELLTTMVGLSISELIGKEFAVEAESHNALSGLFLWINAGRLPLLILIILVLGIFSIGGFLLQGLAHAAGTAIPVSIAAVVAAAGSIPVIRNTSRGLARIIPRDESYAVSDSDFVGKVATVSVGPLDQACRAGFVSRMSSATGTPCRRVPAPSPRHCRSAPACCWSTATPKASSRYQLQPTWSNNNTLPTGHNTCGNLLYPSLLASLPFSLSVCCSQSFTSARRATRPMSAPASAARRWCSTAARWCCRSSTPPLR